METFFPKYCFYCPLIELMALILTFQFHHSHLLYAFSTSYICKRLINSICGGYLLMGR